MAKMKIAVDKQPAFQPSTRIIFLLDRSTSMNSIREEAVAGFNEYLATQQKVEGDATISLFLFDSKYQPIYESLDVKEASPLVCCRMGERAKTPYAYEPQGMTSLFDYIHATIMKFKDTAKKGEKTIFAILTDGDDTSSQLHTYQSVQTAMKEVQEAHEWEVLFLGANMNAKAFAANVGIKMSNVAQFDASKKGVSDAIHTMAFASSYYRGDEATLNAAGALGARGLQGAAGPSGSTLGDLDMATVLSAVADKKLKTKE